MTAASMWLARQSWLTQSDMAGAAVVAQGERVAREQGVQAGDPCAPWVQACDLQVGAKGANRGDMDFIFRVVDEGPEEYAMAAGEVLQQVVGTHLVALVGRIGQAVDQVEDVRHLSATPDCGQYVAPASWPGRSACAAMPR